MGQPHLLVESDSVLSSRRYISAPIHYWSHLVAQFVGESIEQEGLDLDMVSRCRLLSEHDPERIERQYADQ